MSEVVGIDLGTTNSCISIYKDGTVKIIETKAGDKTIPSFVYFDDNAKTIVGQPALQRSYLHPKNGIYDAKRLIGTKFSDPSIPSSQKIWPFKVVQGENDTCQIQLTRDAKEVRLHPEEVSAEVLRELKNNADAFLRSNIVDAVITVPAYFTSLQKQATKDAATIAGLNVVGLITEPTAAALAFTFGSETKNSTTLVYDLGGGTFDVSLIEHTDREMKVIVCSGQRNLGGRDFDRNLLQYIMNQIAEQGIAREELKKRRMVRRLERQCEQVKCELSELDCTKFQLSVFAGTEIDVPVTRKIFEHINKELFKRTIEIMDKMLVDANITKHQIDDVLLVGGSTRIPKIRQMVKDFFGGKEPNNSMNPDEAVAIGAAYRAALLSRHPSQRLDNFEITDIVPHSLGIEVAQRQTMSVIIPKNSPLPRLFTKTYYTFLDFQEVIKIRIFEGENDQVRDNEFLGDLTIEGITPKPEGDVEIKVRFQLDSDGILKVTATESSRDLTKDLHINLANGRLTQQEVRSMCSRRMAVVVNPFAQKR